MYVLDMDDSLLAGQNNREIDNKIEELKIGGKAGNSLQ